MEASIAFPIEASVDVMVSKAGRRAAEINQEMKPSASTALPINSKHDDILSTGEKTQIANDVTKIRSALLCIINHVVASPDEAEGYKNCESVAPKAKLFIARFAAAQEMQRLLTSDRDDHKEPFAGDARIERERAPSTVGRTIANVDCPRMLVGSEALSTAAHRLVESITQVAKASRRPMLDVTRANVESKVGNDIDNDTLREVQHLSDEGLASQARVQGS